MRILFQIFIEQGYKVFFFFLNFLYSSNNKNMWWRFIHLDIIMRYYALRNSKENFAINFPSELKKTWIQWLSWSKTKKKWVLVNFLLDRIFVFYDCLRGKGLSFNSNDQLIVADTILLLGLPKRTQTSCIFFFTNFTEVFVWWRCWGGLII